jgi:hypothetical protein
MRQFGGIADDLAQMDRVGQFLTQATRLLNDSRQLVSGENRTSQAIPGRLVALNGPLQTKGHIELLSSKVTAAPVVTTTQGSLIQPSLRQTRCGHQHIILGAVKIRSTEVCSGRTIRPDSNGKITGVRA